MLPILCPPLPPDTARAAEAVFGPDHPYLRVGKALETIWLQLDFSALACEQGFLADSFYPCALATLFQYWEDLTDRQMSQATRTRLDLKYALHLALTFPGIRPAALSRFRQSVAGNPAGRQALQGLVNCLSPLVGTASLSVDVLKMLSAIDLPSRAEMIQERMGEALEALAACDPDWLKSNVPVNWYGRYRAQLGERKIPHRPAEIEILLQALGQDGWHLLLALEKSKACRLKDLPEIVALRREWEHQFEPANGLPKLHRLCDFPGESNSSTSKPH